LDFSARAWGHSRLPSRLPYESIGTEFEDEFEDKRPVAVPFRELELPPLAVSWPSPAPGEQSAALLPMVLRMASVGRSSRERNAQASKIWPDTPLGYPFAHWSPMEDRK